jgi:hypothetical protein
MKKIRMREKFDSRYLPLRDIRVLTSLLFFKTPIIDKF